MFYSLLACADVLVFVRRPPKTLSVVLRNPTFIVGAQERERRFLRGVGKFREGSGTREGRASQAQGREANTQLRLLCDSTRQAERETFVCGRHLAGAFLRHMRFFRSLVRNQPWYPLSDHDYCKTHGTQLQ